jgi:hypothetical protein
MSDPVPEAAKLHDPNSTDEVEQALAVLRKSARNEAAAARIFDTVINELVEPHHRSLFWGDRMLTLDKSAGFKNDERFDELLRGMDPTKGCNQYASPDRFSWRVHTMIWAAGCALKVPGDFIECGVTLGDMPWIITEALEFERAGKTFYAYDTFEGFDRAIRRKWTFPKRRSFFIDSTRSLKPTRNAMKKSRPDSATSPMLR